MAVPNLFQEKFSGKLRLFGTSPPGSAGGATCYWFGKLPGRKHAPGKIAPNLEIGANLGALLAFSLKTTAPTFLSSSERFTVAAP